MPRDRTKTRDRIVNAANRLFYADGIRAVGVDAIADAAGVTKRTLYDHFKSKDDLIAAYMTSRDLPNLTAFQRWYREAEGSVADRVAAVFERLARQAGRRRWRGCGYLRTAAELAGAPGHPAIQAGKAHKRRVEAWFADAFAEDGVTDPEKVARQIVVLMDGAFATMLVHHDVAYIAAAGAAARTLVGARMAA